MNATLRDEVCQRAGAACEYCGMLQAYDPLPFQIDHIIAVQHGGPTQSDNLALSCLHCNKHKGPNIASLDPISGQLVPLFHPRRDRWPEHLEWNGPLVIGLTPIGRATVHLLALNHPVYVVFREGLIDEDLFPPDKGPAS